MAALPPQVRQMLDALRREYTNGEITSKGFRLKKARILGPYASDECYDPANDGLLEAIALEDHVAKNPKELMFLKDDVLTILGRLPNNMYKGECQGFVGVMHGSFLRFCSVPWWEKASPSAASTRSAPVASSPIGIPKSTSTDAALSTASPKSKIIASRVRPLIDEDDESGRYVVNPGPLSYERAPLYEKTVAARPQAQDDSSGARPVPQKKGDRKSTAERESDPARWQSQPMLSSSPSSASSASSATSLLSSSLRGSSPSISASRHSKKASRESASEADLLHGGSPREKKIRDVDAESSKRSSHRVENDDGASREKRHSKVDAPVEADKKKGKDAGEDVAGSMERLSRKKSRDSKENPVTSNLSAQLSGLRITTVVAPAASPSSPGKHKDKDKADREAKEASKDGKEAKEASKDGKEAKKKHKRTKSKDKEDAPKDDEDKDKKRKSKRSSALISTGTIKRYKLPTKSTGAMAATAVAIRDHIAENDNELMFLQGELIDVLERRGPGVFFGRCEGAEGIFYEQDVVFEGANRAIMSDEVQQSIDVSFQPPKRSPSHEMEASGQLSSTPTPPSSMPVAIATPAPAPAATAAAGDVRNRGEVLAELRRKQSVTAEQLLQFRRTLSKANITLKYRKIERIGSGSFGDVYKALDQETGEIVAIKLVDLEDRKDDLVELQKEIAFMAQFESKYVTRYYGSYVVERQLWIVMEYLAGGSVFDILKSGPIEERYLAVVMRDVLRGLDYLHSQRKLHRDVKAANILLSERGDVKLCDFGVAGQLTDSLTRKNTFTGTPAWMAPEIILNSGYDMRADIWSLGITAIECADGAPPNASLHPMRVLYLIVRDPAPTIASANYSDACRDFVAACLRKDPRKRATAQQLLDHPFIRQAGDSSLLTELIARHQQWLSVHGNSDDVDGSSSDDQVEHSRSWDFDI